MVRIPLWRLVFAATASATALAVPSALGGPLPTPAISLRVAQAYDGGGHTVVSVWMSTNAGRPVNSPSGSGEPLVFTQPWHTTCQADPRRPLPGGKTQLVYASTGSPNVTGWQPVIRIPTGRAQQWTICAYVISPPHPETPFAVVARATASVAVRPPRGAATLPVNQGPWHTCVASRALRLRSVQVYRGYSGGCVAATTIARTWGAQWFATLDERSNWGYSWLSPIGTPIQDLTYPTVKFMSVPVPSLHRTLTCKETATNPRSQVSPLVVNCGLASFKFDPAL
jgi:hypothetical protein